MSYVFGPFCCRTRLRRVSMMKDNANINSNQLSNPPNVANNFMKVVDEHAELLSELCTVHVLLGLGNHCMEYRGFRG